MSVPTPHVHAPLAELARRLSHTPSGPLRRDRAVFLLKTLLRHSALLSTARYLSLENQSNAPNPLADVLVLVGQKRLDAWLDLLKGSLEYLRAHNDTIFVPGLHRVYFALRDDDEDLAHAHRALAVVLEQPAPEAHSFQRFAGLLARGVDEFPDRLLAENSPDFSDALATTATLECERVAAALPSTLAKTVGHELLGPETRVWLKPLAEPGRLSDSPRSWSLGDSPRIPSPGELAMTWHTPSDGVLSLSPLLRVQDARVWYLDHGDADHPRYICPSLGLIDGPSSDSSPRPSTSLDLLGRFRMGKRLGERTWLAVDQERDDAPVAVRVDDAASIPEPERDAIRSQRESEGRRLNSRPGISSPTEVRLAGRLIISARDHIPAKSLVHWLGSAPPADRVTQVLLEVAQACTELDARPLLRAIEADDHVLISNTGDVTLVHWPGAEAANKLGAHPSLSALLFAASPPGSFALTLLQEAGLNPKSSLSPAQIRDQIKQALEVRAEARRRREQEEAEARRRAPWWRRIFKRRKTA